MRSPRLTSLVLALTLLSQGAVAQIGFTDHTDLLHSGEPFTSGVAMGIADMNGDGLDDILRLRNAARLCIEYQTSPMSAFGHMEFPSNAVSEVWALAVADTNRDGLNDILLADADWGTLVLLARADQGYTVRRLANRDIFPQSTIFADIDNDGLLDIFACDDNDDPHKHRGLGGVSFRHDPALLPTMLSGLPAGESQSGNYAALWTDFDNDGDGDLYLSKCRQGATSPSDPRRINRLFSGSAGGFTESAAAANLRDGGQTWCADFADIDNDGDLDCFLLNHGIGASRLMKNDGFGNFSEITIASDLSASLNLFGIQAAFRDFDNDGFVDLLISASALGGLNASYRLYRNDGDSTFTRLTDVLVDSTGNAVSYIQSFATGDLNHDGFVDVYAGRAGGFNSPSALNDLLFLNNGNAHHFLAITLEGTRSNRSAVGARIEIIGPWGTQIREVRGGEGYGVSSSHTQHFGLGTALVIPTLRVRWPSGLVDEWQNVSSDQFLTLTEGETLDSTDFTPPVIVSAATANATQFTPVSYRVLADNRALAFSLSGSVPTGMTIDPHTGIIAWTPATTGLVPINVVASNPAGSDTLEVMISVGPNLLSQALESGQLSAFETQVPWIAVNDIHHDGTDAVRSASIGDNEISALELALSGPDVLSFWWKASSEDQDRLSLYLDGERMAEISGDADWNRRFLEIPDGSHIVTIEYAKDTSDSEGTDAGWVDELFLLSSHPVPVIYNQGLITLHANESGEVQIQASQSPDSYTAASLPQGMSLDISSGMIRGVPSQTGVYGVEVTATNGAGTGVGTLTVAVVASTGDSLNARDLDWRTGGDALWQSQETVTHGDSHAMASGTIQNHQESWLETTLQGPGILHFWWRASSEDGFDELQFHVDDSLKFEISGNSGWQQRSFTIETGPHVVRWTYDKDGSSYDLLDKGWLDEVTWSPADNDGDGLPDGWERFHFKNLDATAPMDPDHDGQTNGDEEIAGTVPVDPSSVFSIHDVTPDAISWHSVRGRDYTVESSTDLEIWDTVESGIRGTGGTISQIVDPSSGHVRVRVVHP